MLDLREILKDPKYFKDKLSSRGFDVSIIKEIIDLGKERSIKMSQLETLQAKRNKLSKSIGEVKRNGGDETKIMNEVSQVKAEIERVESKEKEVNEKVNELILGIPNLPADVTPIGKNEDDNVLIKEYSNLGRGKVNAQKSHSDLIEELDIVDVERAVKISGTRFVAYKGAGAKLLRALKDFMLDRHINNGYIEFVPPVLVSTKTMTGTGQLPKFAEDLFKIEGIDKWLIPTAEVPLTNLYANEIIDLSKPISITAYTQCFRSEAGSGGKDSRGLIRTHQFNKVELVKFVKPEESWSEFEKLQEDAEGILKALELPYQTLSLCSGDIGFSATRTIDLEVWMPSENKYREISSVSHFGDFQARRAMIRYKDDNGKTKFANTLNGSGIAIDRCIAAIIENYQNSDGSITIPNALIPYMGIEVIK